MDWTELIEAFLAAKYHAFSSNTRRAYRYDLMACAQVLATLPIREITVSHLRLFLDATTDLAPTTLARRKAALRSCFRWAYQQDLVPADPTAKLEAIPIGERDPRGKKGNNVKTHVMVEFVDRCTFHPWQGIVIGLTVRDHHISRNVFEPGIAAVNSTNTFGISEN